MKSPKPPAPPPKERPVDIDNLAAGTRQRVVKLPDGRDKIIIEKIPPTAEEVRLAEEFKRLEANSLANIERLSSFELAVNIEEFKPAIKSVAQTQEQARLAGAREATRQSEEALARRGLGDSTTGTEVRDTRERAIQQQRVTDANNLTLFAEQLRGDAIAREANLFGLATGRSDVAFAQALQSSALNAQTSQGIFSNNIQASRTAFDQQVKSFELKQQAQQNKLASIGTAVKLGTIFASGGLSAPAGTGFFEGGLGALSSSFSNGGK